jgi:hypothetical protein
MLNTDNRCVAPSYAGLKPHRRGGVTSLEFRVTRKDVTLSVAISAVFLFAAATVAMKLLGLL